MTSVTSDPREATSQRLPIELLFKAKTNRPVKDLRLDPELRLFVAFAERGSYRMENICQYLRKILPEWTEGRARTLDYRVLMMDVAKSHVQQAVTDLAWSRGYVVLYHYGHTTAVAQVNDTDLHAAFEREYVELETAAFTRQQLVDPSDISRRRQDRGTYIHMYMLVYERPMPRKVWTYLCAFPVHASVNICYMHEALGFPACAKRYIDSRAPL